MRLKQSITGIMLACVMSISLNQLAHAAHGSYNPMMPRQMLEQSAQADYAYGYTILAGHAIDTLEEPNRLLWYLNYDILDRYILRPVAHGYAMLPSPIRTGVGNFLGNLNEVNNIPNNLLVGEGEAAAVSFWRLAINTTFGLLGFIDTATALGLESKPMEMTTVLGKYGVDQGPYLMLPAYGPSTAREIHGDVIDGLPWMSLSWPLSLAKFAISGIHSRSLLIDQEAVVDNALDPYVQTRDVFLMYSENKVNPVAEGEVEAEDSFDESILEDIDNI